MFLFCEDGRCRVRRVQCQAFSTPPIKCKPIQVKRSPIQKPSQRQIVPHVMNCQCHWQHASPTWQSLLRLLLTEISFYRRCSRGPPFAPFPQGLLRDHDFERPSRYQIPPGVERLLLMLNINKTDSDSHVTSVLHPQALRPPKPRARPLTPTLQPAQPRWWQSDLQHGTTICTAAKRLL